MLRVALEISITRFVATGLTVYATNLLQSMDLLSSRIEAVPLTIPPVMHRPRNRLVQKMFAAYWQTIHAHAILPMRAKQLKCDLLHYTMTMPVARTLPCPAIATVHDIIPFVHPEWVPPIRGLRLRKGIASAIQRAAHVVADSEATRQDVIRHFGRSQSEVTAVLLGANTQLPAIAAHTAIGLLKQKYQLDPGYVLSVGSLEPRKNVSRVIEAYASLAESSMTMPPLVFAGGSSKDQRAFTTLLKRHNIERSVLFPGHVSPQDLAALYRCAGVFVYPSLYEGFGLPPLEAMSYDCPVITSNISSLPEVVGDAAIQVNPERSDELAGAIEQLLCNQDLANIMRLRGKQRVQHFSWERCARETIDVYERVVSSAAQI